MKPPNSYIICTCPRSGSTLLCSLLKEIGKAGLPDSHFYSPSLDNWLGYFELRKSDFASRQDALRAIFAAAIERGKGESDIFALRLQRHSFPFFAEQLALLYPKLSDDKSRIEAAFGRTMFVYLTRENKLEQAISYVKAQQSGLWHMASDGTELERLGTPQKFHFDEEAISAKLKEFNQMETDWISWFEKERIKPLRVSYDELSSAPYTTLARILRAIGLEPNNTRDRTPPIAKLGDELNKKWATRFRAENKP